MNGLDRIFYIPAPNPSKPHKRPHGSEKTYGDTWDRRRFMPLRHTKSRNYPFATGCDKSPDCLTCPEEIAKKCDLAKKG